MDITNTTEMSSEAKEESGEAIPSSSDKPASSFSSSEESEENQAESPDFPGRDKIGVNLETITDWAAGIIFTDAMMNSRGWGNVGACWEYDKVTTDEYGWPTGDEGTIIYCDVNNTDISGDYTLVFEGTATVKPYSNATVTDMETKDGISTAIVHVKSGSDSLMLDFVNTAGEVKNVHLYKT